ncbi:MAG: fibronectin type III domain-containing protein, partial [Bacteroidetes bacterium]|nr:fibronectin type III domain-containing protein [Bacteroidota bacterium]
NVNGPFEPFGDKVLPPSATEYIDEHPNPLGDNYYVVDAFDTAGNISSSITAYGILIDSIPPVKPTGLRGSSDTNGIVTLRWKLGPDKDIIGYRVFFANDLNHEFSNLTPYPVKDTMYIDTIKKVTLSKRIYYRIVAVDRNFNHSKVSDILTVMRPDAIPPIPPVFNDYKVSETSVYLSWIPSTSNDVLKHVLYKREAGSPDWIREAEWPVNQKVSSYTVKSLKSKMFYEFTLAAYDSSGHKSRYANPLQIKTFDTGKRKGVTNLKASYWKEKKQLMLSWNYTEEGKYYFLIYRSVNGSALMAYRTVESGNLTFTDDDFMGKGKYQYALKVVYKDGGESAISQAVTVEAGE